MINNKKSIGFYAGGFEYGLMIENKSIRYFDGDEFKFGKSWMLNSPIIESPLNLLNNPVDYLFVFKSHYFDQIKENLIKLGFNSNAIIDINNI